MTVVLDTGVLYADRNCDASRHDAVLSFDGDFDGVTERIDLQSV